MRLPTNAIALGVVTVTLAPLTTEAKRAYVAEYLRVSGKKLSEAQTNAVVESKNTESPLYMRILLDDLRLFASFEDLDARIAALLAQRTVTDLYLHVIGGWRERFPTSSLVDRTLCFLLYSRRGLYESELQELLGQPDHFAWSSWYAPSPPRTAHRTSLTTPTPLAFSPFATRCSTRAASSRWATRASARRSPSCAATSRLRPAATSSPSLSTRRSRAACRKCRTRCSNSRRWRR